MSLWLLCDVQLWPEKLIKPFDKKQKGTFFWDIYHILMGVCHLLGWDHISYSSCHLLTNSQETSEIWVSAFPLRFIYIYTHIYFSSHSPLCHPVSNDISEADRRIMFSPRSLRILCFLSWMSFPSHDSTWFLLSSGKSLLCHSYRWAVLLAAASVARITWFLAVPLDPTSFLLLLPARAILLLLVLDAGGWFNPFSPNSNHPLYPFRTPHSATATTTPPRHHPSTIRQQHIRLRQRPRFIEPTPNETRD